MGSKDILNGTRRPIDTPKRFHFEIMKREKLATFELISIFAQSDLQIDVQLYKYMVVASDDMIPVR